jgi:hypothetical protein
VHHGVRPLFAEQPLEQPAVADVPLNQPVSGGAECRRDVAPLDGRIVEAVEVVECDDVAALGQNPLREVRTDEAGRSGHQDFAGTNRSRHHSLRILPRPCRTPRVAFRVSRISAA